MPKDVTPKTPPPRAGRGASAGPHTERIAERINLVEIRPGLFLNTDHIVSVRVLPQDEGDVYAILQLSNGDKLNITGAEFCTISGDEPRPRARVLNRTLAE